MSYTDLVLESWHREAVQIAEDINTITGQNDADEWDAAMFMATLMDTNDEGDS